MPIVEKSQFDVSFVGREASQMFVEPVYFDDDMRREFRIIGNVPNRKKIGFIRPLEDLVRKYTTCGFNPRGSLSVYEREIEVDKMGVALEICWDEFEDTVFEEFLRSGTDLPNLLGTQIGNILLDKVRQGIRRDTQRLVYFGDKSSVDPSFDATDGFWTVHYPALVAATLIPRTNTGSGLDIAAGQATDMLKAVTEQADTVLKAMPTSEKVLNVTGRVWEAYRADIEDGGGGDYGLLQLINGNTNLYFRGILVNPMWRWDTILANDLSVTKPNYIEYTTADNKVIATDVQSPENSLRSWYDDKDEKVYVKARWKMGSTYIHPSLISVGY